jgi:hypothetical protein
MAQEPIWNEIVSAFPAVLSQSLCATVRSALRFAQIWGMLLGPNSCL